MPLVTCINFSNISLLDRGYFSRDEQTSKMKLFFEKQNPPYVTPFRSVSALPNLRAFHPTHALAAFGDTLLLLKDELNAEIDVGCDIDIHNAADWGLPSLLKRRKLPERLRLHDLSAVNDRQNLVSAFGRKYSSESYPELRLYRGLTWADLDERCVDYLRRKRARNMPFLP